MTDHKTYTCPMHPQVIKDAPGKCPICNMDLVPVTKLKGESVPDGHHTKATAGKSVQGQRFQQYTCPMHPQIVRDEPGSCPICGMDLVPLGKPEGDHDSMIDDFKRRFYVVLILTFPIIGLSPMIQHCPCHCRVGLFGGKKIKTSKGGKKKI